MKSFPSSMIPKRLNPLAQYFTINFNNSIRTDDKNDRSAKIEDDFHASTSLKFEKDSENSTCPFPYVDPFDSKIRKYVVKLPTLNCDKGIPSDIFDVIGDVLWVNKVKAQKVLKAFDSCKYRTMTMRKGNDFQIVNGPWSEVFTSNITLAGYVENLHVECYYKHNLVARSYIALVRKRSNTEARRDEDYKKHVAKHSPKETLSILLVGVDGTSKQNFARAIPRTKEFITKTMNAIEFNKYNKVGGNTLPNVLALLAGKKREELKDWTFKDPLNKIDHLFAWNHYRAAGYRTAIFLDTITLTSFHNVQKKGWVSPPFDYYPRPITIASERDKVHRRCGEKNCMGNVPEITVLHDYWLQLAATYNNTPTTPYFAYSFSARLTHNDQNKASMGDGLYLKFFQDIHKMNVLNNTLIIFFSDHGSRFGDQR